MNRRIEAELALLRLHYAKVEHIATNAMHWFLVEPLLAPEGWSSGEVPVVFAVTEGHPGAEPYGFFVPADLQFNGQAPSDSSASHPPPFPGQWRFLSWKPEGWKAAGDVRTGSNLWGWVRSFVHRLREGH